MYWSNCRKSHAGWTPTLAFHLRGTCCHGRWFRRRKYAHRTKVFVPVSFDVPRSRGWLKILLSWRRVSVTLLVHVGYIAQSWIGWIEVKLDLGFMNLEWGGRYFRFKCRFYLNFPPIWLCKTRWFRPKLPCQHALTEISAKTKSMLLARAYTLIRIVIARYSGGFQFFAGPLCACSDWLHSELRLRHASRFFWNHVS